MSREPLDGEVRERDLFALPDAVAMPPAVLEARLPAPSARGLTLRALARRQAVGLQVALLLEYERGILALLAPVALGVGALIYLNATFEPGWTPLLLGLTVLAAIVYATRERPLALIAAMAALLMLAGVVAAKVETWRAGTRVLGGEISTRITGRVVDIDHLSNRRVRLILDVLSTERPKLRYQPQRVRVSASSLPAGVVAGSVVLGLARLQPPPGPIRPGGYDFSFESYFDGTGANGFFLGSPKLVESAEPAPINVRVRAALDNARNAIAGRIRTAIGGAEGEIAAALIVGVRAGIPEDVNEALRRTGLAHILSISGLHMALVAAAVMVSLRMGMALTPGFAATHPTKKYAAVAALVVLTAYLLVSGVEVAALRSFIMLVVMLVAVLFDRQALTMRNLAIAAIIILLISPHEIVGPSFQMSFAATAALIGGYAIWAERRRKNPRQTNGHEPLAARAARWLTTAVIGIAATAVIAGLATSIFGIWHFQRVSPLTLIANLAVTPIVSLIVMPFGLLAMIAMPFGLDGPFLAVMGKGLAAMLAVSEYLSARSPVDAVGLIPGWSVALLSIALLIGTLTTTRLRLLALPPVLAGLALVPARTPPNLFISEDARLVGLNRGNGELLVNRERPNSFTVEGWARALPASTIVKPAVEKDKAKRRNAKEQPPAEKVEKSDERLQYDVAQAVIAASSTGAFHCQGPLCAVRHEDSGVIAVAANAWTAQQICKASTVVVVQQASARSTCGDGRENIITVRALARGGAATIEFGKPSQVLESEEEFKITYSIAEPYRPWHENRKFSRAARGMEPYQRKPRRPLPSSPNPPAGP